MQKNNFYFKLICSKFDPELADSLLYHINDILYNYSDHHQGNISNFKTKFKKWARVQFLRLKKYSSLVNFLKTRKTKIIISNAYVKLNFPNHKTTSPPWVASFRSGNFADYRLLSSVEKLNAFLARKEIKPLFSGEFEKAIQDYRTEFAEYLITTNASSLIVPNDLSFFENISIKISKKLKIPTFVYLHGLPARYNNIDDNRADYLIVWGNGIKENYVRNGVTPNKILTLPHPVYRDFKREKLVSSLADVLVLTKAMNGTPSSSDGLILSDRGKSLFYVEKVKSMLLSLGVKHARLRLHPSEIPDFYTKNATDNFYSIDSLSRDESLAKATLVVGPTSTMVLDAILANKNYLLYEPIIQNQTLENINVVSPFDGNGFIKLSNSLKDMEEHISFPEKNIDFELLGEFFKTDAEDNQRFLQLLNR